MKFFKGPVSCLCHGWLVHLFIMPIRRPYTCKWQKHSFPPNKSISQALYQTLQTKKMNFETLVYKFHLQLCPSVPPIYISSRFFENQPNEICSRREKAMVALLIFIILFTNWKSAFQLAVDVPVCSGKYSTNNRVPLNQVKTVVDIFLTHRDWNWPNLPEDPSPVSVARELH